MAEGSSLALPGGDGTLLAGKVACRMRWIPAGSVVVDGDSPRRREATIREGFWMLEHPVTQELYQELMGSNPSLFQHHDSSRDEAQHHHPHDLLAVGEPWWQRPVERVRWFDAVEFCNGLTRAASAASPSLGLKPCYAVERVVRDANGIPWASVSVIPEASGFRLPTEVEWEYACRLAAPCGHAHTARGTWHADMDRCAWHGTNSGRRTRPVKGKAATPFGLFDLLGNVWEWCEDAVNAGTPSVCGTLQCRPARGGGFLNDSMQLHRGSRVVLHASWFQEDLGFRVVRGPRRIEPDEQLIESLTALCAACEEVAQSVGRGDRRSGKA